MKVFNIGRLKERRRKLRRNMTPVEARLWKYIRKKQIKGKKIRRQFSVGGYILDFFVPKANWQLNSMVHLTTANLSKNMMKKEQDF